jgi:hypothetical protein
VVAPVMPSVVSIAAAPVTSWLFSVALPLDASVVAETA